VGGGERAHRVREEGQVSGQGGLADLLQGGIEGGRGGHGASGGGCGCHTMWQVT